MVLMALLRLLAADAINPERPFVFDTYYCWYHDGAHLQRPWLHWSYPSRESRCGRLPAD
jgi:hypothetical protein